MTGPTTGTKRKYVTRLLREKLLAQMLQAQQSPAELAAEHGMTLVQMAQWGDASVISSTLRLLSRLADVQAQLMLSRYRTNAALRLIALAGNDEHPETARKACVDLLKANLGVFGASDESQSAPPAPSEKAILRALEELGESALATPGD